MIAVQSWQLAVTTLSLPAYKLKLTVVGFTDQVSVLIVALNMRLLISGQQFTS